MKSGRIRLLANEEGYVIVVAILLLALLSFAALTSHKRGISDLVVASNRLYKQISFHAADSGVHYVAGRKDDLAEDTNIIIDSGITFPNATVAIVREALSPTQEFNGQVIYRGERNPPRGSGSEVGTPAHYYETDTTGYGPRDAQSRVVAAHWRLGVEERSQVWD